MITVEQQVKAAKTPRDALLVLARAVDELRAAAFNTDSWTGWDDHFDIPADAAERAHEVIERNSVKTLAVPDEAQPDITDDQVRAWIGRNYGAIPQDDSEGRTVIAQVRRDLAKAGRPEVEQDVFRTSAEGVIESAIDWAPKDEKHRAARYAFAANTLNIDVLLGDLPAPPSGDWAVEYAKGGPMWLYLHNRELLLAYPDDVKARMVADVERYDQKVAYEMGADLLKQPMIKDTNSPANRLGGDE